MNMNKSGTISANQRAKLLAAFAVIAVVACALCVVAPSADADTTNSYSGDGYEITLPDYDNVTFSEKDGKVTASGYAGIAAADEVIFGNTTFGQDFGAPGVGFGYAILKVDVPANAATVDIVQNNSALQGFSDDDSPNVDGTTKTVTGVKVDSIKDGGTFLIPKDNSEVKFTFTFKDADGATISTKEIAVTYNVTMGYVIDSEADIKTTVSGYWGYTEESNELRLGSSGTVWIINGDISTSISSFDLGTNNLTIADSANGGSLTINGDDVDSYLLSVGAGAASITVDGTSVTVNGVQNPNSKHLIYAYDEGGDFTLNGKNGAVITLAQNNGATNGTSLNYAHGGAFAFRMDNSVLNINGNGGVQIALIEAKNNSTINFNVTGASLGCYLDVEDSAINATNINTYSAKIAGESVVKASGYLGVFSGSTSESAYADMTLANVEVSADSSVSATTIYDGMYSTYVNGAGSKAVTITGEGSVTGALTKYKSDAETFGFVLDGGITISGESSVASGANIDAQDAIVGANAVLDVDGNIEVISLKVLNGASVSGDGKITVPDGATYQVSSEASVSVKDAPASTGTPSVEVSNESGFLDAVEKQYDKINVTGDVTVLNADVYIADWMTVTIDEGVTLTFGTNTNTTGASAYFTNDGKYVVKGTLNIYSSGENNGLITIDGGVINIEGAAVEELRDCNPVFENAGTIIVNSIAASSADNTVITVVGGGLLSNTGSIGAASESLSRTAAITGSGWVENAGNGAIGILVNAAHVEGLTYEVNLSQDITGPVTYPSYQTVIVPEGTTLSIKNVASVVINGKMIVNGNLIIEGGQGTNGKLIIAGGDAGAQAANLEVNGTITVQDGGSLAIGNNDTNGKGAATVSGSVVAQDGSFVNVDNGKMTVSGTMDMQANSNLAVAADGVLAVDEAGTLNIAGYIATDGATVTNSGSVTIANGSSDAMAAEATFGDLTVKIAASSASVNVDSFIMKADTSLTITDDGLVLFTDRDNNKSVVSGDAVNTVTIDGLTTGADYATVSGLVVNESTTSRLDSNGTTRTFTNTMIVSGTFGVSLAYVNSQAPTENDTSVVALTLDGGDAKVSVTAGKTTAGIDVTETLATGSYVDFVNAGDLDVTGTVTVAKTATNNGVIDVTGNGIITVSKNAMTNNNIVNAAYYVIKNGSGANEVTYHNYSTLENAVPAVADASNTNTSKTITIMGKVSVTENIDVPAGISIVFETNRSDSNALTIGSSNNRDVTVNMAVGSRMTSGNAQVVVEGTLEFADKTNDSTRNTVSDVVVEDPAKNGSRTYTNIYTALANAQDGDVVEVSRTTGYVTLGQSVTIPAGVTLYVPQRTASLLLEDGVTLTIDGTLETEMDVLAETKFGVTAKNATVGDNQKSSAIVVNGTMKVDNRLGAAVYGDSTAAPGQNDTASMIAGAPIYGAYYAIDGYSVVSTLEIAFADVADITGNIVVNGVVTVGDLTFNATEDCTAVVIGQTVVQDMSDPAKDVATVLTAGSITVVGGTFGSVTTSGTATVYDNGAFIGDVVVGDARLTANNVIDLVVTDDEGMEIAGAVAKMNSTVRSSGLTLAAGSATAIAGFDSSVDVTVAAGATLASDGAVFDEIIVDGTVTVAAGKNLTAETMTVNGTGAVNVAVASDTAVAGNADVTTLNLGIAVGDFQKGENLRSAVAGPATVSGPIDFEVAYVLNQAVIDESNLDGMRDTVFNVNGSVWFTAYAALAGEPITADKAPVENAVLAGWSETDGGDVITIPGNSDVAETTFVIGDKDNLYAVVNYDIYVINMRADQNAVSSISIDGNIMQFGMIWDETVAGGFYYGYTAVVSAGSHTISYQLANGYSGNGVLTVNGTQQSGLTFTTEGNPADGKTTVTYNLQLTGFEKSGYVPDSPDTPSTPTSSDDGMTITDYLLIVLVVLIIVMAIIVAMRLMRS